VPTNVVTIDASKQGMGGLWVPTFHTNTEPEAGNDGGLYVWQAPFPSYVQDQLVSIESPRGCITNSNLELAGVIVHTDVLACQHPLHYNELWQWHGPTMDQ